MTDNLPEPVPWLPFDCGNTSCPCMEPNLGGPCEEHKDNGTNPRCAECGWPQYRHVEQTTPNPAGPLLRAQLASLGITLAEASRRLGYTPKHLNQVLHGKTTISVDFAANLQITLGIDGRRLLHAQVDDRFSHVHAALADSETPPVEGTAEP